MGETTEVPISEQPPRNPARLRTYVSFRRGLALPYTIAVLAGIGGIAAALPWALRSFPAGPPVLITGVIVGALFLALALAMTISSERVTRNRKRAFKIGQVYVGVVTGFGTRESVLRPQPLRTARIEFESDSDGRKACETVLSDTGSTDLHEGAQVLVAWATGTSIVWPIIPKRPGITFRLEES